MIRRFHYSVLMLACWAGLWGAGAAAAQPQAAVPAAYSFAFFGCNRLDGDGAKKTQSASTANVAQLLQSFHDIAALPQLPRYLFLAGDIVKAKKPGTEVLAQQLSAWVELATDPQQNPLIKKGVPVVAFTGNHELLKNKEDDDTCKYIQCPNPPAYPYWQDFMANNPVHYDFIVGNNGPKQGGADGLLDDESRLSYSLRDKDVLFVILNTDSQIDHDTIGDVPMEWLKQQLQAAQQDTSIHHVFVMGHKPLQSSDSQDEAARKDPGDRSIRPEQAEAFYRLLNDPAGDGSPTKVRGYLAAHAHEWSYKQALTVGSYTGKVPQIVAGNGGSQPNDAWQNTPDAYFGYTLVEIGRNGSVTAQSYGRDFDKQHYYKQKTGKTSLRGSYTLYTAAGK